MMTLGQYIRQKRDEKDLSLSELAKKVECSVAFLSDVELGRRNPSDDVLNSIASNLSIAKEKLKEYDNRPGSIKELSQSSPQYTFAFRTMVDSNIDPTKIIKFVENENKKLKEQRAKRS